MGLAGYVDRDRENNKTMSENIMSEYGVSFWEKSTKPYISNVDDCGDDEDEIENQEVSMYMYNEFPFPIEYKRDFVKIIDDIIGEWIIIKGGKFYYDKIYGHGNRSLMSSLDEYVDKLLDITKKAYGLTEMYKLNTDHFKLLGMIINTDYRKKLIDFIEVMCCCRGEALKSMPEDDRRFLISYEKTINELDNEISKLEDKKSHKLKVKEGLDSFLDNEHINTNKLEETINVYESEIMEINKLIDERKSKLDLLQSEDNKERFDSLCIWARYGNMKGKGRPSIG